MVKLLDNVYTTKLHHREEDKLEWMPSKTQCFQVKSYYKELRLNPFSLTDYLESSCTTKGGFFHMVWLLGKILSTDNLRKRGLIIMDQCFMCKVSGLWIVVSYFLFIWCVLGNAFFCIGIIILLGGTRWWEKQWGDMECCCSMFNVVPWRERNAHCFEGKDMHMTKLKLLFLKILYDWTLNSHAFSTKDFLEFLDSVLLLLFFIFI